MNHSTRKHSKFSASGAERWMNCPGSVALSEGLPDKDSIWSVEGTIAHEVLELILRGYIERPLSVPTRLSLPANSNKEMEVLGYKAAEFIFGMHQETRGSEILVETRISLPFIHPAMFGTFDGAVVDHFGTLHVFDYKYGAGVTVSAEENLQMIFYGMGLAARYDWNFKKVRMWIIQPRVKGYDGPSFYQLSILELKEWVKTFRKAVRNVEENPTKYVEGTWCHWCKAKSVCPLKREGRIEQAKAAFSSVR